MTRLAPSIERTHRPVDADPGGVEGLRVGVALARAAMGGHAVDASAVGIEEREPEKRFTHRAVGDDAPADITSARENEGLAGEAVAFGELEGEAIARLVDGRDPFESRGDPRARGFERARRLAPEVWGDAYLTAAELL